MSKSRDEIKGKRNNHLAANGLLKSEDGSTFDLTKWYLENSPEFMRSQLETSQSILLQMKIMNAHLEIITGEEIKEEDV